jgi:hypothetical protein
MTNSAAYQQKFTRLGKWFAFIVDGIKKDLKQDHLRHDNLFCKQYFKTANIGKLTLNEMVAAYEKALQQPDICQPLGEFMANRWLLNHTEIYDYFESALSAISSDVTAVKKITLKDSRKMIKEATRQFGAPATFVFSVLNDVEFPEKAFVELEKAAEKEQEDVQMLAEKEKEESSWQKRLESVERELARQKDKYEKKVSGLQRLYQRDVAGLKKQIAHLQRKLMTQVVEA